MRTLPPSGNPISIGDILRCVPRRGGVRNGDLSSRLCAALGVDRAFLFSTGRAAMTLLLRSMKRRHSGHEKDVVVVPSYTCYSVAASAIKAGLSVRVCDIDKSTLSYDSEQLESVDFERVLAIISCNLYGLPDDLPWLEGLARQHDVFLIDDAAQSLGATIQGRAVGSFGDAGILSFDKGKVITTINGGVIATSDPELAEIIQSEYVRLDWPTNTHRTMEFVKLLAYALLLRPSLYWIPSNIPFLRLGETHYDDTYPLTRYFDLLAPLAAAQLSRLQGMNDHRRLCAQRYSSLLEGLDVAKPIEKLPESQPAYLRFPVRILDRDLRLRFLEANRNLGCSVSYPASIADIPEIHDKIAIQNGMCEAGREVAAQIVTLPTHAYVHESDITRICSGLER